MESAVLRTPVRHGLVAHGDRFHHEEIVLNLAYPASQLQGSGGPGRDRTGYEGQPGSEGGRQPNPQGNCPGRGRIQAPFTLSIQTGGLLDILGAGEALLFALSVSLHLAGRPVIYPLCDSFEPRAANRAHLPVNPAQRC